MASTFSIKQLAKAADVGVGIVQTLADDGLIVPVSTSVLFGPQFATDRPALLVHLALQHGKNSPQRRRSGRRPFVTDY